MLEATKVRQQFVIGLGQLIYFSLTASISMNNSSSWNQVLVTDIWTLVCQYQMSWPIREHLELHYILFLLSLGSTQMMWLYWPSDKRTLLMAQKN